MCQWLRAPGVKVTCPPETTEPSRGRPFGVNAHADYERLHKVLGGGSWLVGRVTGQEFARAETYPTGTGQAFPREPWIAGASNSWAIVIDPTGRIAWGRADIDGDPVVVGLSEAVSDDHLAGLRANGAVWLRYAVEHSQT